ncbi:MAG: chorismate--pyruvate lyase family protein [bacterium]
MFRSHGFLPEGRLHCASGSVLDLTALPPFLRTLLVADGTVTKSLEAYFWEAVSVVPQRQCLTTLSQPLLDLETRAGDSVLQREVVLRGDQSGRHYAFARSFLLLDPLEPALREGLEAGVIGIGELLREQGIETYREIVSLDYHAEPSDNDPTLANLPFPLVSRSYRIRVAGSPAFLVTEFFPVSVFSA